MCVRETERERMFDVLNYDSTHRERMFDFLSNDSSEINLAQNTLLHLYGVISSRVCVCDEIQLLLLIEEDF